MTYTADMNNVIALESGNWMTGFIANLEKREVTFTYHDRRRNGQIARTYTVKFKDDLSTVEDIVAVSAKAGRIEHFKSTVAREVCANVLRRAKMVKFEQDFEEEVKQTESAKVSLSERFEQINVESEKKEAILHGSIMTIVALLFVVFTSTALYLMTGGEATKETMDVLLTSGFAGIFLFILSMMKP